MALVKASFAHADPNLEIRAPVEVVASFDCVVSHVFSAGYAIAAKCFILLLQ